MLDAKRLLDQFLGGQAAPVKPGRESDLGGLLQGALGGRGLEGLLGGGAGGGIGGALGGLLGGSGSGGAGGLGAGGLGAGGLGSLLGGNTGKAAIAAGLAGLLLKGGKKPKRMAKSAVKLGGLALVAGLAYRAYQNHRQGLAAASPQTPAGPATALAAPSDAAFLPQEPAEEQSRARTLLRAMIAAAKADGHVDAEEQSRLFEAVDTLALDADDKAFLLDELRAPLDVSALVADVNGVEEASEIYLVSRLMTAETDTAERAYLDDLARRLDLPPGLSDHLDAQVEAASE